MLHIYILQNILVLGAFSSLRTIHAIGETSFGTCCNVNCRRLHQVALQIMQYPTVPRGTACCITYQMNSTCMPFTQSYPVILRAPGHFAP